MAGPMPAQVQELPENKVKLTVDVTAHDMPHAVEHAANDLAATVRIPGFRRGKVPMPLLLQRIGKERLYAEAVESHIGGWFWNAATLARVNPIAQPEYEYELPSETSDWSFSATVQVQPKPEPADWTTLEVPKHEAEVPEEAVRGELEMLQRIAAVLVPVEGRPAQDGDTAIIDLVGEDGSAQRDYVVELGTERLVEEIENGIRGLSVGESREIAYELATGAHSKATVTVKELREPVLPPLDDDLAKAGSEFDTLEELRADAEARLRAQIDAELDGLFRAAAIDELVRASNFQAAGPLVEVRTRELLNGLARSLESRGVDAASYLQLTGQTPEVLQQRLYAEASMSVSRELVLEAVAEKLGIQVGDDEIRQELRDAGENDEDIEDFIAQGGADRVRDDIRMKKALDRIAAEVKPIAPDLHEARESIWTPEKDQKDEAPKLWTPGSKE
jgi:trigger factor